MALKTFNLDEATYRQYSDHCKEHGISMSKQVEKFITHELEKLKGPVTNQPPQKAHSDHHSMSKFC